MWTFQRRKLPHVDSILIAEFNYFPHGRICVHFGVASERESRQKGPTGLK